MATIPSTSSGDMTDTTTLRLRETAAHAQLPGVRSYFDARSCNGSAKAQPGVKDEDIDPFTYRPRLTKWNYVKVRMQGLCETLGLYFKTPRRRWLAKYKTGAINSNSFYHTVQ